MVCQRMDQRSGQGSMKGTSQELEKETLGHRDVQRILETERQTHTHRKSRREADVLGAWPTRPKPHLCAKGNSTSNCPLRT